MVVGKSPQYGPAHWFFSPSTKTIMIGAIDSEDMQYAYTMQHLYKRKTPFDVNNIAC